MGAIVLEILAGLASAGPELEKLLTDVATGEGGIGKIEKVVSDLGGMLGIAQAVHTAAKSSGSAAKPSA